MPKQFPTTPEGAQINKSIRRAMFEADKSNRDLELELPISHASAYRALRELRDWRPKEINEIAAWLGVDPVALLPDGKLTWDLVLALAG
jgi:hypothetical protein